MTSPSILWQEEEELNESTALEESLALVATSKKEEQDLIAGMLIQYQPPDGSLWYDVLAVACSEGSEVA